MIRLSLVLVYLFAITNVLSAQVNTNDSIPPPVNQLDSTSILIPVNKSNDTTTDVMQSAKYNPNKAALYSAVIPGLGQAYNKKYWKIPIIWAGLGAFAYFINYDNDNYQFYRVNLIYEVKQIPGFINETPFEADRLKSIRDKFRRDRDNLVVYSILFYLLNIVDAHVDAHLMEFDVNQDLSVMLQPALQSFPNGNQSTGLSLTIKF